VTDATTPVDDLSTFAFVIPAERFCYRKQGRWAVNEMVGPAGIRAHLQECGWTQEDAVACIKGGTYNSVYGAEIEPNAGALFEDSEGKTYLNTWTPPALKPEPGVYPTIELILARLTNNDERGAEWLAHWLALKIQNPAIVPKVAVVFTTRPAGGKGTLAMIMREMLGAENCAVIENGALESRFNSRWARKLFVLADEVLTSESYKDVSNRLKVLIDADTIELEGKGENQISVRNRLAWMFASNDDVAPVVVEDGDRRYSVFSNHDPVTPEWKAMLNACFEADRRTPTAAFRAEIAAFYHDLLQLEVDRALVATPYENADRQALIEANQPGHRLFFKHVDEMGIDGLLERVQVTGDFTMTRGKHEWDRGPDGVSSQMLYACYVLFCKDVGAKALKSNRFGVAAHKHGWAKYRAADTRLYMYRVRRGSNVVPSTPRPFVQGEAVA
jgi:hypothetical protein